MRTIKSLVLVLLFIFSNYAFSFGFNYPNNKKGFSITPIYPSGNGIVQKSGDVYTFEGDICVIKWGTSWEQRKKEKCYKVVDEKLNFKAYFPDEISDVTSDVKLSYDKSKKKWSYKYTTPTLAKGKLNRFTLVVGSRDDRESKLQQAKAKIDQLVIFFKNRKEQVLNSKYDSSKKKKHIEYLDNAILKLQGMIVKIDKALENSVNTLAHIAIPLQVDNEKASEFSYSSNFSGQKMAVTMNPGVVFHGETVATKLRVTNLSHLNFPFPLVHDEDHDDDNETKDDGSNKYSINFLFNDINIFTSADFVNEFGYSYEKELDLSRVKSTNENDFYFELKRVLPFKDFFNHSHYFSRKWGALEGSLSVADDSVAPTLQINSPDINKHYFQNLNEFILLGKDARGKIELGTFNFKLSGEKVSGEVVDLDLSSTTIKDTSDFGQSVYFTVPVPTLDEGHYTITSTVKDFAGNVSNVVTYEFYIDRTAPVIHLGLQDNILTNQPLLNVPVGVDDRSPIKVSLKHNNILFSESDKKNENFLITLTEGLNTVEVNAIDAAGNVAIAAKLNTITLDTIPPVLSNLKPENNSIISFIQFPITANSNEPLKTLVVNGVDTSFTYGSTSINYSYDAVREGPVQLNISVLDLAGNQSDYAINAEVLLKVLRPELISIFPDPNDPSYIIVQGTKWAARPGAEISTGVLGLFFTVADEEGRFQFNMPARTDIGLVGYDRQLNRTDYAYLKYDIDTTFSGLVYSLDGKPLVGVKVSINSTGQNTLTNESGAFRIQKPATGDQIVSFDATGISELDDSTMKVYHKTNVAYTLGNNQLNVISKPIILVPLVIDGNETIVEENQSATVTSPDVDGFSLEIAANNATFPSGEKIGEISVQKLAVENVNVNPPAYVKPKTVYALEPSGLKFTEPAKLTLPNDNEFPPNTQLVLMSKNSETGIWEIDGLAKVTEDGDSVETVEGGGITHFSEVFAAPIAPKLSEFNADSTNGAVINNNGSKATVSLPSVKIMGEDLSPSLVYNSSWANPKMIVSNIIAVDKQERTIARNPNGVTRINGTKVELEFSGKTWVEPEKVYAWAATGDVASQKYLFSGVPNNSLISYALDLTNLNSGYHSYLSQYEIQLKQMTVGTVYVTPKGGVSGLFGDTVTSPYEDSHVIEELYPQALPGNIIVQNKINSSEGRGWKLGLTKNILDVNGTVLSVESEDGAVKTYHANNNISTIYTESTDTPVSISRVHSGEKVTLSTTNGKVKDISLSSGAVTKETQLQSYSGSIGYNYLQYDGTYSCGWSTCSRYRCYNWQTSYTQYRQLTSVFKKADGSYVGSDINGAIFNMTSGSTNLIAGLVTSMSSGSSGYKDSVCGSTGMSCYNNTYLGNYDTPGCGTPPGSSGVKIATGFSDGAATSSQFNKITDVIDGFDQSLLVVDYGNNRIRSFNQSANTISTFAGNGQNFDAGDGKSALQASFYHPQGIATDDKGNVYVSTENGYVRKIDSNGYVTTIAGLPITSGGKVVLSGFAKEMALVRPYGMVVDNAKNILYVADSGNNRVLGINLSSLYAQVVAGDGTCSPTIKDNIPATSASICNPEKVALDSGSNLIIFDKGHKSIRKVIFNNNVDQKLAYFTLDKDGSILEKNSDKSFSLKTRNGTVTGFNLKGQQVETVSRSGVRFDYEYNIDGKLESVLFENKNIFTINYNGDYLASITDKAGKTTYFDIDNGILRSVQFPDGTNESYTYDSQGRILTFKDKQNRVSSFEYNAYGEMTKAINAKGDIVSKGFGQSKVVGGSESNPTPLTDYSDPTLKDYVTDPKGNSIELKKDFKGYVNTIVDQRGLTTTIERDADGRPLKVTRPDDTYVQFTYNQSYFDLIKKFDSGTNVTLEFNYNDYGDLLSTLENGVVMKENSYESGTGYLLSESNKMLNQTVSYNYQELGLVSRKLFPNGDNVLFDYDEWGNLVKSTGARGETTDLSRDNAGNVVQIINPLAQITKREYDYFNRLKSVTTSMNEKTTYEYTLTGQLSKIIDPTEKVTSFIYNELDQLTSKTTPDNFVTNLAYDSNGNVISKSDSTGRSIEYQYNKINKVIKKVLPDDVYEFVYDIKGNITTAKNDATQVNFTYKKLETADVVTKIESFGRGFFTSLPSSILDYEYDLHGNRTKMTERGEVTSYAFDSGDRLRQITNHKGEVFAFNYDNKNRITEIQRPGSNAVFDFYENDMLKTISHSNSNEVISLFDYVINNLGNITSITTKKGTHSFGYDNENQLTSSTNPELTINELYSYDSLGNRIADQTGNYTYNESKQKLTEDPKHTFAYDLRGNLIQKMEKQTGRVHKYSYNTEDKLVKFELFDLGNNLIKEESYTYDVLGRRVEKISKNYSTNVTKTRRFVYDGQEVLLDLDEDNNVLSKFTHSTLRTDDVLSADVTDLGEQKGYAIKGSYQYLKDHLGSVVDVADNSGNILQHFVYSVFGEIKKITDKNGNEMSNPVIEHHFAYTGREFDEESNLYFYRARHYDPQVGRFLQTDPDPGKMSIPLTFLNKYIYAGNNPIVFDDPSGQSFVSWLGEKLIWSAVAIAVNGTMAGANPASYLGAAIAVGYTALGSAVAASVYSLAKGGDFSKDFMYSFDRIYMTSLAFMTASTAYASTFGGGASFGHTGIQGQVYGNSGGGLSLGPVAYSNGVAAHESGHAIQFALISGIQGYRSRNSSGSINSIYRTYLTAGAISVVAGYGAMGLGGEYDGWYNPFEWSASYFGGAL